MIFYQGSGEKQRNIKQPHNIIWHISREIIKQMGKRLIYMLSWVGVPWKQTLRPSFTCMKFPSEHPRVQQGTGVGDASVAHLCPSLQPHGLQPTRLLCPWDSLGKSTGVGCHFLLRSRQAAKANCDAVATEASGGSSRAGMALQSYSEVRPGSKASHCPSIKQWIQTALRGLDQDA